MPPISRRDRRDLACALAAFLAAWLFLHGTIRLGAYAGLDDGARAEAGFPKNATASLLLGFPACAGLAWFLARRRARIPAVEGAITPVESADFDWLQLRTDLRAATRESWIEPELHTAIDRRARRRLGLDPGAAPVAPLPLDLENRATGQVAAFAPETLLDCGLAFLVGDAGTGKTTLLTQVARELLAHAETHPATAVPLFLSLGAWTASDTAFPQWLCGALAEHYGVPATVAARLLAEKYRLTLLLESFDEIASDHRPAALQALRQFRADHPAVDLVITTRPEALTLVGQSLLTKSSGDASGPRGAEIFRLLPLGPGHVEAYLSTFDRRLETLRRQLHDYPGLRAAVAAPLLLHLIAHLAAAQVPVSEFSPATPAQSWVEAVARRYARLTLDPVANRDLLEPDLAPPSTLELHWLQRLARGLARQNRSAFFFPVGLDPAWLNVRLVYYVLLAGFLGLLSCSPLFLSLESNALSNAGSNRWVLFSEAQTFALLLSSCLGLLLAFECARRSVRLWLLPENPVASEAERARLRHLTRALRVVFTGLALGLIVGAAYYLRVGFPAYGIQWEWVALAICGVPGLAGLLALVVIQFRDEHGHWFVPDFTPLRLVYLRVRNFIRSRGPIGQVALRATASATAVFALWFCRPLGLAVCVGAFFLGATLALLLTLAQRARTVRAVAVRLALAVEGSFPLSEGAGRRFLSAMERSLFLVRQNRAWAFRHRLLRDVLVGEPFVADPSAPPIPLTPDAWSGGLAGLFARVALFFFVFFLGHAFGAWISGYEEYLHTLPWNALLVIPFKTPFAFLALPVIVYGLLTIIFGSRPLLPSYYLVFVTNTLSSLFGTGQYAGGLSSHGLFLRCLCLLPVLAPVLFIIYRRAGGWHSPITFFKSTRKPAGNES